MNSPPEKDRLVVFGVGLNFRRCGRALASTLRRKKKKFGREAREVPFFNFCLLPFTFCLRRRRALLRAVLGCGRALARETFAHRLLGAGRAQVSVEVEAEQLL